jgi:predicted dehydrogenase
MVGHVLRFWPGYTELHDRVVSGEVGEPRHFLAYRFGPPPAWANWYLDMSESNGVIFDLGIHDIDFIRWTMGTPRSVFSQVYERSAVHAHGQVLMDYGNGEALVECSWIGSATLPFTTYAEVAGPGGLIHVDGRANNSFGVFGKDGLTAADPYHEDGYVRELRHFIECVRKGEEPSVPISEGLETIRLCLAAVESATRSEPIATG